MSSSKLSCDICCHEFNQSDRIARIIPTCGHTFCSKCINDIMKRFNTFQCPTDRRIFPNPSKDLSLFPINFFVQALIEERMNYEICQVHKQKLRLICITDSCKVCDDCVFNGKHKGHDIKSSKKIFEDVSQKILKFESTLKEVRSWHEEFTDIINTKEMLILDIVKKDFANLKAILNEKEAQAYKEIQDFFAKEKNEIISHLGENSSIQKNLTSVLSSLRKTASGRDPIKALQTDLSKTLSKIDSHLFEQRLKDLNKKLQDIGESFSGSLRTQTNLLKNMNVKVLNSIETISLPSLPRCPSEAAFLRASPPKVSRVSEEVFQEPQAHRVTSRAIEQIRVERRVNSPFSIENREMKYSQAVQPMIRPRNVPKPKEDMTKMFSKTWVSGEKWVSNDRQGAVYNR